jgi:AcrR family transcriptional regulator
MMSSEKPTGARKRPYTLKARARHWDAVHLRITEAAVHLHATVGPARTTVSDIAKRARVQRATVYNHFPTDRELIDACSSHWFAANPPPDPEAWRQIQDPGRRVEAGLGAMYAYYERGQSMLERVLRDAPLVPALAGVVAQKWEPLLAGMIETLAGESDRSASPGDDRERHASLRVALDFATWRTLAASGLSGEDAARLVARWVAASRSLPAR